MGIGGEECFSFRSFQGGLFGGNNCLSDGEFLRRGIKQTGKKLETHHDMATIPLAMRFVLIDKIISIEPGSEIRATKSVSLAEEYLADHFPAFPVLPGVLLLQGLIESASWLVRVTQDFAQSMILLEQARNVKYKSFLSPGNRVEYTVKAKSIEQNVSSFTAVGCCGSEQIVEARFSLRHFNLADENPRLAVVDAEVVANLKERLQLLRR